MREIIMSPTATSMVKIHVEVNLSKESLVKVLVADDLADVRDSWQGLFIDKGFKVDAAATLEEAGRFLRTQSYDVVVSDIGFEGETKTGDEFIIDNYELMRHASIVAITGLGRDRIKFRDQLDKLSNVVILEKGGDQALRLLEIADKKLDQRKQQVEQGLKDIARQPNFPQQDALMDRPSKIISFNNSSKLSEYMLERLQQTLVKYFRTRKKADEKSILYGNRAFSPNDLAGEVENGTDIGREHLETMIELFEDTLNIK